MRKHRCAEMSLPDGVLMQRPRIGDRRGRRVAPPYRRSWAAGSVRWWDRATTAVTRCGPRRSCAMPRRWCHHSAAQPEHPIPGAGGVPAPPGSKVLGWPESTATGARRRGRYLRQRASPRRRIFAGVRRRGYSDVAAVDLPAASCADQCAITGPAVRPVLTVTFRRTQTGARAGGLRPRQLVDIGTGTASHRCARLQRRRRRGALAAARARTTTKYSQGVTGVLAGSSAYPGAAAILWQGAAVAATSGMVRYAGTAAAQVVSHCWRWWPRRTAG